MCEIKAICYRACNTFPVQIVIGAAKRITQIVIWLFEQNAKFDDTVIHSLFSFKARLSASCNNAVSSFITNIAIPALSRDPVDPSEDIAAINQANGQITATRIENGIFLTHKNVSPHEQKVIVFQLGNNGQWQDNVPFFKALAELCRVDVLCSNYCNPYPEGEQALIRDGENQVLSLITKGIHPKHILLLGHGFGTSMSILIAEALNRRGITVHAGGDAPIVSISRLLKARYPRIGRLIARFVKGYNFRLNIKKAVEHLPGKIIIMQSQHDPLIPVPAQLIAPKTALLVPMEELPNNHSRPYTKTEADALKHAINSIWN